MEVDESKLAGDGIADPMRAARQPLYLLGTFLRIISCGI